MATVTMDAMDPKSKGLAKLLKKNNVKMEILTMKGPSGWPEVELTGKREDLETVLADDEYGWGDPALSDYIEEGANVNEAKIVLKRRYTENHPAITVGKAARIRNKMLEAIADGVLTEEEFNDILSEYSSNAKQWIKRNAKFFNVSEEGIKLSRWGRRILAELYETSKAAELNEKVKVTKDKFPYIEFKDGGKKYEVEFDQGDIIDDHGNEGKDWYYVGVDQFGDKWEIDVYTDSGDEPEDWFHDTIKRVDESEYIKEGRKFVAAAKKAKDAGDEEFEFNGKKFPVTIKEGNAFGAARAKAIADGKDEFTVDGETYPVEDVDKEDKENAEEFAGESFVYESFSAFVESLNETKSLNEAFKSMKLARLLTPEKKSRWNKGIAQQFYNYTKVKLDKVEDHDLLEVDPKVAYKQKGGTKVKFFLIDNEKQSPYVDNTYDGRIPAGLIAILDGDNNFIGKTYDRWKKEHSLRAVNKSDSIGVSKKRKGYGATGLSSAKRIADFADRAIVVDVDLLKQRYSAEKEVEQRKAAKKGATAFKSNKDFKAENVARYREILANKAAKLPLDKMVKDAIDKLADQIKEGLSRNERDRFGEIIIGRSPKGREGTLKDASRHMTSILDEYDRYVRYISELEYEKTTWEKENSFYAGHSKESAKKIKDKIDKIDNFKYIW